MGTRGCLVGTTYKLDDHWSPSVGSLLGHSLHLISLDLISMIRNSDTPIHVFHLVLALSAIISKSPILTKGDYQALFWVLIDLMIDLLCLIIKSFDHQKEI